MTKPKLEKIFSIRLPELTINQIKYINGHKDGLVKELRRLIMAHVENHPGLKF